MMLMNIYFAAWPQKQFIDVALHPITLNEKINAEEQSATKESN